MPDFSFPSLDNTIGSTKPIHRVRHVQILEALRVQPTAIVKELAERLEVSPSTVRRDLDELEAQGWVRRTFGGVILENREQIEPPFEFREELHAREKDMIGRVAAEIIQDDQVVFIDGGTTTQFIVPYLTNKTHLTVVTCGLNVAYALNRLTNLSAIVLGGEIHPESHSITGPLALAMLELYNIRCNLAFLCASGYSAKYGVTNSILDRLPLKRKAMAISERSVLVADGSKAGIVALGQIAPFDQFSMLITDSTASPSEIEAIREQNVEVRIAS
jgi:DeoR/GlpR family transcriptional regulator of sugar metabolism